MVDDRYLEGIWYDAGSADFCRIEVTEETESVVLVGPDHGDIYHEWTDPEDFPAENFYPAPERAVKDPVGVFVDVTGYAVSKCSLPIEDDIGYDYARQQVEITEK